MSGSNGKTALKRYQPEEIIFKEGEPGNKIYIIKQGSVRIVARKAEKNVTLGVLPTGACFGEMAVISSAPRVATAVAETLCEVYEIDRSQVDKMIGELPALFRAIVNSLIKRVTQLNNFAAEKASMSHPLASLANLICLVHNATTPPPDLSAHTDDLLEIENDDAYTTVMKDSLALTDIYQHARSVLGLTESAANALVQKLAQLKLGIMEIQNGKKVFTFNANKLVQDTNDLIKALGNSIDGGFTADLEYVDLSVLAKDMGIKPSSLISAISSGRINQDAIVLKQSEVRRCIEEQGRNFF